MSGGIIPMRLITRTMLIAAAVAFAGSARPAAAQDDVVKKGQTVYAAQKCSMCHSIAGKGSKSNPLDGVGKKLSADEIRSWIVAPIEAAAKAKSTKKPPMPDKYSKLPAADIDALVAYMVSLK
jgi:mono/diheme cytochrome c family protein